MTIRMWLASIISVQYMLSASYMAGCVLGLENTTVNKRKIFLLSGSLQYSLLLYCLPSSTKKKKADIIHQIMIKAMEKKKGG